jgi:hypothetical protein
MTLNPTPLQVFDALKSKKDGPIKKFELIKAFGSALRQSGSPDPKTMSCAELESQIATIIHKLR